MRRPSPVRQQGFGLLAFVLATAVVAFSLVVGYSGTMVRQHYNSLQARNEAWLKEQEEAIRGLWREEAFRIDQASASNPYTVEDILKASSVTLRWNAEARLSKVLTEGDFSYRVLVLYMPSESDSTNPPNLAQFELTGVFQPCANAAAECAPRQFVVISSYDLQKEMTREAQARLNKVAYRAQAQFKARMLLDPERNVGVNYFRKPSGSCLGSPADLDCLDTYTPLASQTPGGWSLTPTAKALQLTDEELVSPWGHPIEASNLQDSESTAPPFTMAFRVPKPSGGFLSAKAVQQL